MFPGSADSHVAISEIPMGFFIILVHLVKLCPKEQEFQMVYKVFSLPCRDTPNDYIHNGFPRFAKVAK